MSDSAFTAETAAQHQAELNDYLQSKNINQLFIQIVESLLIEKPDNPIGFIVQFLQKKYPDQAMIDGPQIDVAASAGGSAEQPDAAAASDEDEEDEENSDDDYVDDLPISNKYQQKGDKAVRRSSVLAESPVTDMEEIKIVPKSAEDKQGIVEIIEQCMLFKHLEPSQLNTLADAMESKTFDSGDVIIKQGDDGDYFYVVDSGHIDCFKDDKKITNYSKGGAFGELAIMYNAPRAATCQATEPTRLWALERKAFKAILMKSTTDKRNKYREFLSEVEMLSQLNDYEKLTIADSLNEESFDDGKVVCRQGEPGDTFYIVKEGTAVCTQTDAKGQQLEVARLSAGQYFGEIALLTSKTRQATVAAEGELAVLSLDRKTFKRVMGPMENILKRNMEQYTKYKLSQI